MNEAAMFDTLQAHKDIQEADFTEKQADGIVKVMSKFVASHNADLATKGDLDTHREASKRDLAELETRLTKFMVVVGAIAVSVMVSVVVAATIYLANIVADALAKV